MPEEISQALEVNITKKRRKIAQFLFVSAVMFLPHFCRSLEISSTRVSRCFFLRFSSPRSISNISTSKTQPSFTISYLINTCGLSPHSASAASKYVRFETPEKPDSVLAFFKTCQFSKSEIAHFVTKCPALLTTKPERTLKPKIDFFLGLGIAASEIPKVISPIPELLKRSLKNQIIPAVDFLKTLSLTNEEVVAALKRSPYVLNYSVKKILPKIETLRKYGIPEARISKLVATYPETLGLNLERFDEIVRVVSELGFDPKSSFFVFAVRIRAGMSESKWSQKLEMYRSLGWSEEQFLSAFKLQPMCMVSSEKKLRSLMNFFVKEMGWGPSVIFKCPNLLILSLEKRIYPRCLVLKTLVSKGLVDGNRNLTWALTCTEKNFVTRFVIKNREKAPELMALYEEKLGKSI